MSELKHENWAGTTYGSGWMHRWLINSLKFINVRLVYLLAFVAIVPPTMIINSKAAKSIYKFYRKGLKYGALKSAWYTYKNHCAFSQVIIDKFAMYAGKKFTITKDGYEDFENLANQPEGFVQLSSHIGNYEIAGYSLVAKTKRFNALVFGGEKDSVMSNRNKLFEDNNIRMIPMKPDMSHLFEMNNVLADGEILSMSADRVFGSQKSYKIDFYGHEAHFPQGPFLIASMRDVPMLYVAVMKKGIKKYHIIVKRLPHQEESNSKKRAKLYAEEYVDMLQETVRNYPTQWFNYFDIWAN